MRRFRVRLIVLCIITFGLVLAFLFYSGVIWFNNPSSKDYPVRGIDVSNYQGTIEWSTIAEQEVDFAFIKATEGSSFTDKQFSDNWKTALDTEILVGAYHFFSFDSSGEEQAANFINTVPRLEGTLSPVVDIEFYNDKEKTPPNYDAVYAELTAMLDVLKDYYGVKPIIYTTQKVYALYISKDFQEYPLWIRNVINSPSLENREWLFWQYSDHGNLEGYDGEEKFIDLNVFNGSYEKLLSFVQSD